MLDEYSRELFAAGAVLTFLGSEAISYLDPPHLFTDPMAGQVLGWQAPGFAGRWSPLFGGTAAVERDELATLRRLTAGLSDRS